MPSASWDVYKMASKFSQYNVRQQAEFIVMLMISIVVVAAMSTMLPALITNAGFTGAAATLVALIPVFIPIGMVLYAFGGAFSFLRSG